MRWETLLWATAMLAAGCATGGIGPSGRFTPVADHHQHLFSPDIVALLGDSSGALARCRRSHPPPRLGGHPPRGRALGRVHVRESAARGRRRVRQGTGRERLDRRAGGALSGPADRVLRLQPAEGLRAGGARPLRRATGASAAASSFTSATRTCSWTSRLTSSACARCSVRRTSTGWPSWCTCGPSISRKRPYGAAQARIFLEQLLPLAADVPVQIAHLAGTGPGYDDPPADSAMAVLADAVAVGTGTPDGSGSTSPAWWTRGSRR